MSPTTVPPVRAKAARHRAPTTPLHWTQRQARYLRQNNGAHASEVRS